MFSPRRNKDDCDLVLTTPERINMSPLRAIASPLYEAVKTVHSKATRDFGRFYENLQTRLSPRTSNARIKKPTSKLNKSHQDLNRTSLTPLIERHTLYEDTKAKYQYKSRNPFSIEKESEETPSLLEREDVSIKSFIETTSYQHEENRIIESKRLDNLLENLTKLRKQASLLADDMSNTNIKDNESEEFTILDHAEPSCSQQKSNSEDKHYLATPPQSIDYVQIKNPIKKAVLPAKSRLSTVSQPTSPLRFSPYHSTSSKRHHSPKNPSTSLPKQSPKKPSTSLPKQPQTPLPPRQPSTPLPRTSSSVTLSPISLSPINSPTVHSSPVSRKSSPSPVKDFNDIQQEIANLEALRTPGGSRVLNRFWNEIHRRESLLVSSGRITKHIPISKRISNLQENVKKSSSKWSNDDGFWSSNTPVVNSFTSRLAQATPVQDHTISIEKQNAIFEDDFEDEQEEMMVDEDIPKVYPNVLAELKDRFKHAS